MLTEKVGHVNVGGHLRQTDYEMIDFLILVEVQRGVNRTAIFDFWRADFGLLWAMFERVPGSSGGHGSLGRLGIF